MQGSKRRRWAIIITFSVIAIVGVLLLKATGFFVPRASLTSAQLPELSSTCRDNVLPDALPGPDKLRTLLRGMIANGDLRSPGSDAHNATLQWIENELSAIPGLEISSDYYAIERWQPAMPDPHGKGRSLYASAQLMHGDQRIETAGAVPYSLGTGDTGMAGQLIHVPQSQPITEAHKGKIILRPYPSSQDTFMAAPPYPLLVAVNGLSMTADIYQRLLERYDRPYPVAHILHEDLIKAGQVGAAGMVITFDVPTAQIRGYWDPHHGVHYQLPAAFVGIDEAQKLLEIADADDAVTLRIYAERDEAQTRNIMATLPGLTTERIVLTTNTDGNTWVQENGSVALLALAQFFAERPIECRQRTLQFAFGSAHLHMSREGTLKLAEAMDEDYDDGTIAFAFGIEHLGTREQEAVPRKHGLPGRELVFSGRPEPLAWTMAQDHSLFLAVAEDVMQRQKLKATTLMNGVGLGEDTPQKHCYLGGLGTYSHSALIPSMSMITGPWALWAPSFGEAAIDYARMHRQITSIADTIVTLDRMRSEAIAGPYLKWREMRRKGQKMCSNPPFLGEQFAPGIARAH